MLNSETRKPFKVYGIIVAGGRSERFKAGLEEPEKSQSKILTKLAGHLLIEWSLAAFAASPMVDAYLLLANPQDLSFLKEKLSSSEQPKLLDIIPGGESRQESVFNGLSYLSALVEDPEKALVLVHDGARPLLAVKDLELVIKQLSKERCGAGLCTKVTDSLRRYSKADPEGTRLIPREECFLMQTPQGAPLKIFQLAAKLARKDEKVYTDDLALLEAIGYPVRLLLGSRDNLKITTVEDLALAEFYLESKMQKNPEYYKVLARS